MNLADIKSGQSLIGLVPNRVCSIVAVTQITANAVKVFYELPDGTTGSRLLGPADEDSINIASTERPWSFDGDPSTFQLTCEAKRMDLAFLFDPMMAVNSSNVDPLPHQITAVYESMLPRQPLRFVLADDPGAGKTIMAGLYISELIMRADAQRILIIAPGSLVDQWRDELLEKFGLEFRVYSNALDSSTPNSNPFKYHHQLIVRLDQLSRDEEGEGSEKSPGLLQSRLLSAGWDLVVFDEAHKLAAHFSGSKLDKTARFRLAERLGSETRHLLLMTATPHNGKEDDFQLFLSLLDSDRFYGKSRNGVQKVDTSDLIRRMIKEELVKFDGTPLFPERKAYTVNYTLSNLELALYEAVTQYVQTEMGKAEELDGKRKNSVGFALTALQRRLASSPEAIYQSLKRRHERLSSRLNDERTGHRGRQIIAETVPDDEDDLNAEEQEEMEERLVDEASAASTIAELEAEILVLEQLEKQAKEVVVSNQDRKWEELSKLLQNTPEMHDASGRRRKIIIFSEHRDTLNYLYRKIAGVLGAEKAIVVIHGGTSRDERRRTQANFRSDKDVCVLVATDAAGEGVNLQCANLMVNYDLPWNPNRLEQRFGRIHRIGQKEVCHLWSLVASQTREGAVWERLLNKLSTANTALKGKVFNVLGDVFEEESLRELMIQAIRYGDDPAIRAKLTMKVENALDHAHVMTLLNRNALVQESMSAERLFKVKDEMEKAQARRLQPFFVRTFFNKAFVTLGGTVHRRELDRFEIKQVPFELIKRDRRITGRNRREQEPVLDKYERICFDRSAVKPDDKPGLAEAVLMHPGHPLMLSLIDIILERNAHLLRQGAVFIDPTEIDHKPWMLILLSHEIKSGDGLILSRRIQFIRVNPDGSAASAGWAPHLDLEPLVTSDRSLVDGILAEPWITTDLELRAISHATGSIVEEHYTEVATRRIDLVDRTLAAVHERLTREIRFWTDKEIKLREDKAAGKDVRLNLDNVTRTLNELRHRLERRKKELQSMRQVMNDTPVVLGGALVVPISLVRQLRGEAPGLSSADVAAREKVERLAMEAVIAAETAKGNHVVDVSAAKCGWDISSYPPDVNGVQSDPKHIEVKGRAAGADTITVTNNEIMQALNQAVKFVLAIVFVNPDDSIDGPYYLPNPFLKEPDWGVASVNYNLRDLVARARKQA